MENQGCSLFGCWVQDLDLVVFDHLLWLVFVPFLIGVKFILPTWEPMQMEGGHFIMVALVFLLRTHSKCDDNEGVIFNCIPHSQHFSDYYYYYYYLTH